MTLLKRCGVVVAVLFIAGAVWGGDAVQAQTGGIGDNLNITIEPGTSSGARTLCRCSEAVKVSPGRVYSFACLVKVSECQGLAGLQVRWTGADILG